MSKDTSITWCDSSLNLEMGCDGCELWNRKLGIKACYSGKLTDQYGGRKGWPSRFEEPEIFPERIDAALKWKDLTGAERPEKPWLNGLPRIIFLNDMGDTFTESLPIDWLAPFLPRMAASPHHWLLLTKRPSRMADFSKRHPLPPNVWPGTSVTSVKTVRRLDLLRGVVGGGPRWCSGEPLLGGVDFRPWLGLENERSWRLDWLILGGESGGVCRELDLQWIRHPARDALEAGVALFVKQLGGNPGQRRNGRFEPLKLQDAKGEEWSEWPEDLQFRQMPVLEVAHA